MRRVLIASLCLLAACERTALSPVEIKIDNDIGGFATSDNSINNTYTVIVGETLFDVANKFNIEPMSLARLNNINAPYDVKPGQVLKLPVEGEVVTASTTNQQGMYAPVNLKAISEQDSKDLDKQFETMVKNDTKKVVPPKNTSTVKEEGFNAQAEALSSPKVVSTATGAKIPTEIVAPKKPASGKMIRPVEGKVISKFGDNLDGIPNDGINIKAAAGTPVNAVSDGEVIYAGNNLDESFGNVVVVQHKNGLVSSYAHLKNINVKKGAKVSLGQKIGSVGKTGDVTDPQLHFEIMKNNTPENPEKFLEK